jgi:hypothetical protein
MFINPMYYIRYIKYIYLWGIVKIIIRAMKLLNYTKFSLLHRDHMPILEDFCIHLGGRAKTYIYLMCIEHDRMNNEVMKVTTYL